MTADKYVVDASALGALLFGEPQAGEIAELLGDRALAAPTLLGYEMANLCLKKLRRYPDRRPALLAAFEIWSRMAIDFIETEHDETLRLAEETGLTAYDASYLWLTRRLGCELVTLDAALAAAAAARGER